ncbi:hypothetical protein BH24DEI2_BH24DEI2_20530 [soil metagenome]
MKKKQAVLPSILLACPDAAQRRLMVKALVRRGHRVADYGDGGEVLAYLQGATPALLVLDANLPSLGGVELCFRTKRVAQLKDVPVIVLAFAADTEAQARAERGKADKVLTKPVTLEVLVAAVEDLLEPAGGVRLEAAVKPQS